MSSDTSGDQPATGIYDQSAASRGNQAPSRRTTLWWLTTTSVALLSASYVFDATVGGIVPVVQALSWLWLVVAVSLAAAAALSRRHLLAAISMAAAALAMFPLVVPTSAAACATDRTRQTTLSVMSFNAGVASADTAQLGREILQREPDLVVLLEVDQPMLDDLRTGTIGRRLPFMTSPPSDGGVAGSVIMSKYPLEAVPAAPAISDPTYVFDQPAARVNVGGTKVLVHAVHTYPPILQASSAWHESLDRLGQWQRAHSEEPVIMAGDFNASRSHPVFRYASAGMNEASRAQTPLAIPTWPSESWLPGFVAIDHILVRDMIPTSFDRVSMTGSDHHALAASLTICST